MNFYNSGPSEMLHLPTFYIGHGPTAWNRFQWHTALVILAATPPHFSLSLSVSLCLSQSLSPKKTFAGNQLSVQDLKREVRPFSKIISWLLKPQPSNSKFSLIRTGLTVLGTTEVPRWMPHMILSVLVKGSLKNNQRDIAYKICWGDFPLLRDSSSTTGSLNSGEPLDPRQEYAVQWMPWFLQYLRIFQDGQ